MRTTWLVAAGALACGLIGSFQLRSTISPAVAATTTAELPFALRLLEPAARPIEVASADLDGDGTGDLLLVSAGEVSALYADSQGLLRGSMSRTATVAGAVAAAVADLDGDQASDVIYATESPAAAHVLLSSVQRRLFDHGSLPLSTPPGDLVAIRTEGSLHDDLVVSLPARGALAWFRGEGDGTFSDRGELELGGTPTLMVTGEFDRRPGTDLIVLDASARTLNRIDPAAADGAFPRRHTVARVDGIVTAIVAVDLDRDGLTDLLVAHDDGTVSTLLSTTTGKLAARPEVGFGEAIAAPVIARIGDNLHLVALLTDSSRIASMPWSQAQRTFVAVKVTSVGTPTSIARLAVRAATPGSGKPDSLIAIADPTPPPVSRSPVEPAASQLVPDPPHPNKTEALAPTITLTGPTTPVTVKEGDDFFSTVMNNPLDFDARRDFYWEELFNEASISVAGGNWAGTFAATGSYVFPLFAGFPLALNTGRVGANFPIDTTRYKYVSYRSRVSSRSSKVVYWGRDVQFPDGSLKVQAADGYFTNTMLIQHPSTDFVLDTWDLSANTEWTASPVKAVRIDPSTTGPAGTAVLYDWVRITDPSSAPMATITWTTVDIPQPNMAITPQVNVYVDNDNVGFDGAFLGRVAFNANTFSFPSSALPAGSYYFYLKVFDNTDGDALVATSGYSSAYTVDGKTRVMITAPSRTSGPDYATEVRLNPWDLDAAADIDNLTRPLSQQGWTNPSFSGGAFNATAVLIPPAIESDSQVWMKVDPARPINTKRYRYLSYEMAIDPANFGNISDKVMRGWVSRIIWWSQGIAEDGTSSKGNVVYEGRHTYTLDLTPTSVVATDDPFPRQSGWRGNLVNHNFRLDMTETAVDTNFSLFDVKLRARPEPTLSNEYTIAYSTTDPESQTATVKLYIDSDNTGFDGNLLSTAVLGPGTHTSVFSTQPYFPRDYWVYAEATDPAGNVFRTYSDAPIHLRAPIWNPFFAVDPRETPFVGDFNGDRKTDIITFTRDNPLAFGDVYVSLSTGSAFGSTTKWHDFFAINLSEQVVIGDYTGDFKDDIATYLSGTSRQVYVARSNGNGMEPETLWLHSIGGNGGDALYAADADGDGKDDLILFARVEGKVYVALSTGTSFAPPTIWHNFFAVSTFERPRVGDLNGDGKTDIITFATDSPTAFGDVYVALGDGTQFGDRNNASKWHDFFAIRPEEHVVVDDLDGDGKDDFLTFLPEPFGQVYAARSLGNAMGPNLLYLVEDMAPDTLHSFFGGDADGDGRVDIIEFDQLFGVVRGVSANM